MDEAVLAESDDVSMYPADDRCTAGSYNYGCVDVTDLAE